MGTLPITNVINVTISAIPSGLTTPNVNSLMLMTNEAPNNSNPYGIYVSANQVAADYGTNSATAAMANAVFSQVPNVLSGGGQLVIAPMQAAVSATPGVWATPDISSNLANFQAVSNGSITITIDGIAYALTGLNFTQAGSLGDIANILQTAVPLANITLVGNTIKITSNKVGSTGSTVTVVGGGAGSDLYTNTYLKGATATTASGANSSGETILAAVNRLIPQVFFCGVMTNLNLENAAVITAAAGIQALDMMFVHHAASPADIAGLATTIQQAGDTHTRILVYTLGGQAGANLMKAAYAGRGFSTDFTGSATSTTMNLKQLANILPDPNITQTLYTNDSVAGADLYVSYQGVPSVYSTGGDNFFDNVYQDIALKFALQTAGFNYLRQTNTKVPQTEPGMNGLKSAYALAMEQFVVNGSLAPGAWNSSQTFGDPAIFNNNVLTRGYYIYSQPVALQNSSDRNLRKAPLVQIAAKRAGAIHSSNVIVIVNN